MRHFSIIPCIIALAVLAADVSSIAGQVTPAVITGSRVRLTAPTLGLSEAVGTVRESTDEALVVQFEFPPLTVRRTVGGETSKANLATAVAKAARSRQPYPLPCASRASRLEQPTTAPCPRTGKRIVGAGTSRDNWESEAVGTASSPSASWVSS